MLSQVIYIYIPLHNTYIFGKLSKRRVRPDTTSINFHVKLVKKKNTREQTTLPQSSEKHGLCKTVPIAAKNCFKIKPGKI